jgi:hypothetical protein
MQRMFIVKESNLTEKLKNVTFSPSKLSSLTAISCFATIVFHIWLIVVFHFLTITLFVVQDISANNIQALKKVIGGK